jgi:hypothetical protein
MTTKTKKRLLMAAVAGISLGVTTQPVMLAQDAGQVKCFGINACGAHAKCSVGNDDLAAVRRLLGDREFKARFGKSQAHSCGAHAKCGASAKKLNWTPVSAGECSEKGGFVIETVGGKKVAKKA